MSMSDEVGEDMMGPQRQKRVTLAQVAEQAGLSIATVSRALSGCENVSDGSRRQVTDVARRLGYLQRHSVLAAGKVPSAVYGIVVPSLSNATFSTLVESFQRSCFEAGANVLVGCSQYDPGTEEVIIRQFMHMSVQGIVLVGNDRNSSILEYMVSQGVTPITTVSAGISGDIPSVGFDNVAAARELTEYLLDIGHREIGLISGRLHHNDRSQKRVEGVRQALTSRGLNIPMEFLVEQSYRIGEGCAAARHLMSGPNRPSAIICGNDLLAFGAMTECLRLGFDIPGDVSIAGIDDMEFSEVTNPSLTSVSVPIDRIGECAAEILQSKILGRNTSNSIVLPTKVVVRGSTRRVDAKEIQQNQKR